MGADLLAAFALFLVMEGLMPFLAPKLWRQASKQMGELRDGQLRFIGLGSIAVGLLLYFVF
jgi:uncharacterized protein